MAGSLRNRLLLSYALLILVLVVVFSAGTIIALLQNPLVYERSAQQLRSAQQQVIQRSSLLDNARDINLGDLSRTIDQKFIARAIFTKPDGTVLADSRSETASALRLQSLRLNNLTKRNEIGLLRDNSRHIWLALVHRVNDNTLLILAVPRPRLGVLEFFSNEFLRPVIWAGLAGLLLAIVTSLAMTRWIITPLRKMEKATRGISTGQYQPIQLEGPAEIRQLADSFNRMSLQVQNAWQSQRDLVANISHELKTPLTSIQGFTQAILDNVIHTPQDVQKTLKLIFTEAERMTKLVHGLVSMSRLESGSGMDFARVDMGTLIGNIAEKFQLQAAQAQLTLIADVPDLPAVWGDADRLAQVISNLLDNAIKYTQAGGSILIDARQKGASIQVRITDTGAGVLDADKSRIFERFYRSEHTRVLETGSSAGLGLAITRQIVSAHGGTIHVEDNNPQGSIFTLVIPVISG
jgi:signal transduction histidine kinase